MRGEWDSDKAASNRATHGVSLDEDGDACGGGDPLGRKGDGHGRALLADDSRVDEALEQVDGEVHEDEEGVEDQDDALEHRDVALKARKALVTID